MIWTDFIRLGFGVSAESFLSSLLPGVFGAGSPFSDCLFFLFFCFVIHFSNFAFFAFRASASSFFISGINSSSSLFSRSCIILSYSSSSRLMSLPLPSLSFFGVSLVSSFLFVFCCHFYHKNLYSPIMLALGKVCLIFPSFCCYI